MEIKLVLLQFILIMELVSSFTIRYHMKKHFCGPVLSDTLQALSCVYYRPSEEYVYSPNSGIVEDCCINNCTEYELVKMYCESSDIHHLGREMPITERSNAIQQEFYEQNMMKKLFPKNDIKKETQVQENTTYRPAVVGINRTGINSVIRIPRYSTTQ